MICLWSGKDTSQDTSREHIIPENVGGKGRLPGGYVSDDYNKKFSENVDRALRFHPAFATSYQIHDHIKGKKRTGKNRQRKGPHPKEHIEKGNFKSICKRNEANKKEINSINPDYLLTDTTFIRALHRSAAHILASRYGVERVRNEYMPLLEFVLTGGSHLAWSYTVCFANPFFSGFGKEFDIFEISNSGKKQLICLILHASGIWGMSPEPDGLDYQKIEVFSDVASDILNRSKIKKYFGTKVNTNRQCIGSAFFYWCKPKLPVQISSPLEDNMVFTNCRICGQILKTGITLKSPLNTQIQERHGDDRYYRVYLFRSQNAPDIDKVTLICDNCLCERIYDNKELYVFEFNRKGTFEI